MLCTQVQAAMSMQGVSLTTVVGKLLCVQEACLLPCPLWWAPPPPQLVVEGQRGQDHEVDEDPLQDGCHSATVQQDPETQGQHKQNDICRRGPENSG